MGTLAPLNRRNMAAHPVLSPQEYLAWWNTADPVNSGRKTMASCHQLVALSREQLAVQTQMLAVADPGNKTAEIEQAAARAEASLARIQKLEQELKAARALNADVGGDRLLELLTELLASNKRIEARPANSCCVVS